MTSPLLHDILNQSTSLAAAVDYHFGAGRAALYDAARLLNGQAILFSGMGSSLFACYALSAELAQQGVAATLIDTAELLHYHYRAYRDAVAVLVSRSGESIETIKLLPLLKAQGTRIVGVTDVADSTLAREADATILIHGGKDHLVAVQSYTATLIALQLLGTALLDANRDGSLRSTPNEVSEHAVRMPGVAARPADLGQMRPELDALIALLARYIPLCVEQSEGWRSFFDGAQAIHLLGRGRSIASIYEGALLFNEVAKFPAVPMPAAQFRHGPVEIVDERYRAIVFAPDDHTRALNIALARDLNRLGGQAQLIGPLPDRRPGKAPGIFDDAVEGQPMLEARVPASVFDEEVWWPTPNVPAALAPLIEIVPVQCAAMRLAEWRGFTPGEFRVATQVTRSEAGFE